MLAQPDSGVFRFAHRRMMDASDCGVAYRYSISEDLSAWRIASAIEEDAAVLLDSPGYEVVTLRLPETDVAGEPRVFLRVSAD